MLPLCATGQSRVHYCCGSPQYKRELIVFSMIDTLGLNANLFNLWLELIALMEVNLVFSNHPETRKEVLHFYDYSSREYMLPILHTGDNIWQILIEPVLNFTDNNGFLNLPLWIHPHQPWESIIDWILNATFLPFVESLEVVKQLSPWCRWRVRPRNPIRA